MATPSEIIWAQQMGRKTPLSQTSGNATALSQERAELLRQLGDNEERIANYRKMVIEQGTEQDKARLSAAADLYSALADLRQAQATGQLAKANFGGDVFGPTATLMAKYAFMDPDSKAVSDVQAMRDGSINAMLQNLGNSATQQKLGMLVSKNAGDPEAVYSALSQEWNTFLAGTTDIALNRLMSLPEGGEQVWTADTMARDGASHVLGALRRTSIPGLTPEQLDAFAKRYSAEFYNNIVGPVAPALQITDASQVEEAVNTGYDTATAQRRLSQSMYDYTFQQFEKMGVGAPEATKISAMATALFNSVGGDPVEFGKVVQRITEPQEATAMRNYLLNRIDLIDAQLSGRGSGDPLLDAIEDMKTRVPGFAAWQQAMRFNNPERAALYAAGHPYELQRWVQDIQANPTLMTDPVAARAHILDVRREQGWGFLPGPVKRTFGAPTKPEGAAEPEGAQVEAVASPAPPVAAPAEPPATEAPPLPTIALPGGAAIEGLTREPAQAQADPAEIIDPDGQYKYRPNEDGSYTITASPRGGVGATIRPGDPGYMTIRYHHMLAAPPSLPAQAAAPAEAPPTPEPPPLPEPRQVTYEMDARERRAVRQAAPPKVEGTTEIPGPETVPPPPPTAQAAQAQRAARERELQDMVNTYREVAALNDADLKSRNLTPEQRTQQLGAYRSHMEGLRKEIEDAGGEGYIPQEYDMPWDPRFEQDSFRTDAQAPKPSLPPGVEPAAPVRVEPQAAAPTLAPSTAPTPGATQAMSLRRNMLGANLAALSRRTLPMG